MKFCLRFPGQDRMPGVAQAWHAQLAPPDYQRIVGLADELGFSAVNASEHLALPVEEVPRLGAYWHHALTVMAFVAGATRRIRVNASVIVLPLHHPVELAKAISTLDVLSGGRVTIAVGVGYTEREFQAVSVPFAERGRITDEMLELMKLLWTGDEPAFDGEHFSVKGVAFEPRPVQDPHPPIWIGGNSKAALRRAARNDGWLANSVRMDLAEIPRHLEYLQTLPDFHLRTRPFEVAATLDTFAFASRQVPAFSGASPSELSTIGEVLVTKFAAMRADGVTFTSVPLPGLASLEDYVEFLHWFAEQVMPEFPEPGPSQALSGRCRGR